MMSEIADLSERSHFDHFTDVTIRYCDQDPMGHVNNIAIAAYIEAARVNYIYDLVSRDGVTLVEFVLVGLSISFRREFHWPGTVEVGARMTALGTRSFETGYGVFIGDVCHATARCQSVFFDMETRKSAVPPDDVLAVLDAELAR